MLSAGLLILCSNDDARDRQDTDKIADTLQKRISATLSGRSSYLTSAREMDASEGDPTGGTGPDATPDGDLDGREDDSELCDDEETPGMVPTIRADPVIKSGPVCETDASLCDESENFGDNTEIFGQVDLGWFDGDPPVGDADGPRTATCFQSPFVMDDPKVNAPLFAVDHAAADTSIPAAFVLVIDGISGYGMLPIKTCGLVGLPGTEELCGGQKGGFTLKVSGTLVDFLMRAGEYMDFEVRVVCP